MANASVYETGGGATLPGVLSGRAADWLRTHAGLAAVLVFAAGFLSPMLRSGFYFDDIKNSCISGYMRLYDSSLATIIEQGTLGLMHTGRLFPGALAITHTVHVLFPGPAAYKVFLLACTLANLVQFYALLRCWKVRPAAAQLATLALVLLLQMRAFGDPVLGFASILQVVVGQLLLSMICLQRHLESGRWAWLAGSVAIYLSSLLTYEISYLFVPVYLAMTLAHGRQWRSALATAGPFALAAGVLTCYVLGLRHSVPMPPEFPYRFNLSAAAIVGTAANQASAALPLSYALLSPHSAEYFDAWRVVTRWDNWAMALPAGVLACILLRTLWQDRTAGQRPPLRLLLAAGLMIWILPGLAISASPKYQGCVLTGVGYLPVYVQYYGVPLIGLAGLLAFAGRFPALRGRLAAAVVLATAAVTLITFDTNRHVVDVFPSTSNCPGQLLVEAAFKAGLAENIPDNATVITTKAERIDQLDDGPPVSSGFVTQCLRRKVNFVSEMGGVARRPLKDQLAGLQPATFVLGVHCRNSQVGCVILGSIDRASDTPAIQDALAARSSVRSFRVFMRDKSLATGGRYAAVKLGSWHAGDESQSVDREQQTIDVSQWKLLRSGPDWAIYEGTI